MPPYLREFRSTLQHRGETQVPVEVREYLGLKEGEILLWLVDVATDPARPLVTIHRKGSE